MLNASTMFVKRIPVWLCIAVTMLVSACTPPSNSTENTDPEAPTTEDTLMGSAAGTCVPIMVPEEFIFLSW